ncbi:unnamed protein product [Trichogramma brassicae]|uniref:Uncharacterized protein n=1 Tax=Trichogramma brassicae TaxID=86971 RepID=A0A6H5IAV5_9HYME|nr:unnamed protein product [Trichogramma brassicae]
MDPWAMLGLQGRGSPDSRLATPCPYPPLAGAFTAAQARAHTHTHSRRNTRQLLRNTAPLPRAWESSTEVAQVLLAPKNIRRLAVSRLASVFPSSSRLRRCRRRRRQLRLRRPGSPASRVCTCNQENSFPSIRDRFMSAIHRHVCRAQLKRLQKDRAPRYTRTYTIRIDVLRAAVVAAAAAAAATYEHN